MTHLLVVESKKHIYSLIDQHKDFSFSFAETLREARDIIQKTQPDLVLVDCELADGQGTELLHGNPDPSAYAIIVMVQQGHELDAVEAIKAGAINYLIKSDATLEQVIRLVERSLREWERILHEDLLRQSTQQSELTFRTIIESISEGILLIDETGRINLCNTYIENVFGYTRSELHHQMIEKLLPLADGIHHSQLRETYMQHPTPRHHVGRNVHARKKNGTVFPVEVGLAPIEISGTFYIMCMLTDITEQVHAQKALQDSEQRFRSLTNAMDDMVYTLDHQHRFTNIFGQSVKQVGYTQSDFIGKTIMEVYGEESAELHQQAHDAALKGQSVTYRWTTRIDNDLHWYQSHVSPIVDGDGVVTGVVGIGRDITELEMTKQQLEENNRLLEQNVAERTARLDKANQLLKEQIIERRLSEEREHEQRILLESIYGLTLAVNKHLNIDDTLDSIMNTVDKVVAHDIVNIILINPSGTASLVRARGYTPEELEDLPREFTAEQHFLLDKIASAKGTIILDQFLNSPNWVNPERHYAQSILGTPIIALSNIIGYIILYQRQADAFTHHDVDRMDVYINHAALAIRNAQMYEQAGELAVIKDRQRLARDLHDAVTQTLFSAGVVSDSLIQLWETKPDKVYERLVHLNQLTQGALAEMRTLLVELRPHAIENTDFNELVQQLLVSFRNRSGIMPTYTIEQQSDNTSMPADVKEVFYRILQEALSNINKHAHAKSCKITLYYLQNMLVLQIIDDGIGIDTSKINSGIHMGLRIMQERATSIDAALSIVGTPPSGTHIEIRWKRIG